MKKITVLIALLASVCFSSCSYKVFEFGVVSTKDVDFWKSDNIKKGAEPISGYDRQHFALFIPLNKGIKIDEAVKNTLKKHPGAVALIDGTVKQRTYVFLLYSQTHYKVEGTPLFDLDYHNPDDVIDANQLKQQYNQKVRENTKNLINKK